MFRKLINQLSWNFVHFLFWESNIIQYTSSSKCSAKSRFFTANAGTKAAVLPKAGLPPETEEPRLQFYQGWIGALASRCFPHHTLSLASEQTLKDLRRSQGHQREGDESDSANWALRTSPKFSTGVKYQFHQGFWQDQRSGNPNQPSSHIQY